MAKGQAVEPAHASAWQVIARESRGLGPRVVQPAARRLGRQIPPGGIGKAIRRLKKFLVLHVGHGVFADGELRYTILSARRAAIGRGGFQPRHTDYNLTPFERWKQDGSGDP